MEYLVHTMDEFQVDPKSYGVKKIKYLMKNKRNKKKEKYSNVHNSTPLHRVTRHFVNSYINHNKNNINVVEEFVFPHASIGSSTRWDCPTYRPKVF
jgi:hypothetical protein